MRRSGFLLALPFVLAIWVYGPSIRGEFQFDDFHSIVENPAVHHLDQVATFFTNGRTSSSIPENSGYRPLTTLGFALCWVAGNGQTWPFHFYKICLHALICLLVALILLRLFGEKQMGAPIRSVSAAVAIFAVHPSLSETVNYISATSTLQCAFFYLLAFYCYLRTDECKKPLHGWHVLMGLAFFAAMLSKEEGATFPLVITFHALWFGRARSARRTITTSVVIFALYLSLYLTLRPAEGSLSMQSVPWTSYSLTQVRAWFYYLLWIVRPWGFSVEHADFGFSRSIFEANVLCSLGLLAIVIVAVIRWRHTIWAFAAVWYLVTILPASSIFPLAEPINEHRYYLSFALALPMFVMCCARRLSNGGVARMALLLLVPTLGLLTQSRNAVWATPVSLWKDALMADPTNGRVYNNLGILFMKTGDFEQALRFFARCNDVWPDYKYCYLNKHISFVKLNRWQEAEEAITKVLALDPHFMTGYWHKAIFLSKRGRPEAMEAVDRCNALARNQFLPCLELKTTLLLPLGRAEEALEIADQVLEKDPNNRLMLFQKGLAWISQKRWDESLKLFESLYARDSADSQALYNMAWVQMQRARWEESKALWLQVIARKPDAEDSWANLKVVAEKMNDRALMAKCDEAVRQIEHAKSNR